MRRYLLGAVLAVAAMTSLAIRDARADLLVASGRTSSVLRYGDQTGAFLGTLVPSGSGGLSNPQGLAIGPDGNLYTGSFATGNVLGYDETTGAFRGVFVPRGSGGLGGRGPYELAPIRTSTSAIASLAPTACCATTGQPERSSTNWPRGED